MAIHEAWCGVEPRWRALTGITSCLEHPAAEDVLSEAEHIIVMQCGHYAGNIP
jgi:hypothetical protein